MELPSGIVKPVWASSARVGFMARLQKTMRFAQANPAARLGTADTGPGRTPSTRAKVMVGACQDHNRRRR